LESSHRDTNRRFIDLLEEPLIHGFVLDFGLHPRAARISQRSRRCNAPWPAVRRRLDAETVEQGEQRLGVAILGFNDVHEWTNRAEGLNDLAICCARLVLVVERLAHCFNGLCIQSPIIHG